ncbi:MAG: thiamine diphosphokinase [Firmicutes bacterium]|nr:thiamine diphosphokinase [Bacillota bacterium]
MRCLIFANGAYGDLEAYRDIFRIGDKILCADGGSNYAYQLGIRPDCIIGDLDSIEPEVEEYYTNLQVPFQRHPTRKDLTDIQLCLDTAHGWGVEEIIMLGSLGKRLDHTLANLYAGMDLVGQGLRISHFTPECWVYIINRELEIFGQPGDIVSVLALTDQARGFSEVGFEYDPFSPLMQNSQPYAVSNLLTGRRGTIRVEGGILAVFHYFAGLPGKTLL